MDEYTKANNRLKKLQKQIPSIIPTVYRSSAAGAYPGALPLTLPLTVDYPTNLRYVPYIKDGYLQVFVDGRWQKCHSGFRFNKDEDHIAFHKQLKAPFQEISYSYGCKILNYTKNLQIQNTIYDSYTHEYLGDYLRFHRDFANINLMPLYNCFSNRACPHLDIEFEIGNGCKVKFKTDQSFETALYNYYMIPVKFFKDYTIAIDSEAPIEVCCCVYNEYQDEDTDFAEIPKLTYQCFGDMQFKTPVLYSKLHNLNTLLAGPLQGTNDLCQQENNLKLILKVPVNNKSSIVILEGNFIAYNDRLAKSLIQNIYAKNNSETYLTVQNKTTINYEYTESWKYLTDKLITPLQLLRTNTGESYPFADRLVEYLVGNAITVNDEIKDNIERVKTVVKSNCTPAIYSIEATDGVWEPILQCLVYDYINSYQNLNDINHDILGFIDKDVEKWYAAKTFERNNDGTLKIDPETNKAKVAHTTTIANIDIYN